MWDLIENSIAWGAENPDKVLAGLGIFASYLVLEGGMDAAEAQAAAQQAYNEATNEQRLQLERWNRGALDQGGNSILPLYFGEDDPTTEEVESFEATLANDLQNIYARNRDGLTSSLANADQIYNDMLGTMGLTNQFIDDVYTGELAADRQALIDRTYNDFQQGLAQRLDAARNTVSNRQSVLDSAYDAYEAGLQERLNNAQGLIGQRQDMLDSAYGDLQSGLDSRFADAQQTIAQRQAAVGQLYGDLQAGVDSRIGQARGIIDDYEGRSADLVDEQRGLNEDASIARRAAINSALGDQLKQVQFNRQRLGLGGGSSFANNLAQNATIAARQQAAMGDINDSRALVQEQQRLNEYYMPNRLNLSQMDLNAFTDIGQAKAANTLAGYDQSSALDRLGISTFSDLGRDYMGNSLQGFDQNFNLAQMGLDAYNQMGQNRVANTLAGYDQNLMLDQADLNLFSDLGKAYTTDTMFGFDKNYDTQLNLLNAPLTRAEQAYAMARMPYEQEYSAFDNVLDRLNFFKIQGSTPQVTGDTASYLPTDQQLYGNLLLGGLDAVERFGDAGGWFDDEDDDSLGGG